MPLFGNIARHILEQNEEKTNTNQSVVYFTEEISPESLVNIFTKLGIEMIGKTGVKISTGEPGGHNFLDPKLIQQLVNEVNGTIVECNTAYPGKRKEYS